MSGAPHIIKQFIATVPPLVIVIVFAFIILLQAGVSMFMEGYFVRRIARWRTDFSMEYISDIANSEWFGFSKLQSREVEVMLTMNIGRSMKLRHMTALFISDCIWPFYISVLPSTFRFIHVSFCKRCVFIWFNAESNGKYESQVYPDGKKQVYRDSKESN